MSEWSPRPVDGIEVNEVADGLVLYRPEHGEVHYLNSTAAAVFVLAAGHDSVAEIITDFTASFPLVSAPAGQVVRCLDALLTAGLVR